MRKTLCIAVALCVILSLAVVAFAAPYSDLQVRKDMEEMNVRQIKDQEYVVASCTEVSADVSGVSSQNSVNQVSPRAATRLEFAICNQGVYVISDESYVIKDGELTTISIDTCVWAPEHYEIEIGLWNGELGVVYSHTYTGGSISNRTRYFWDLPAGTYYLFVCNNGSSRLSTGYLLYDVG